MNQAINAAKLKLEDAGGSFLNARLGGKVWKGCTIALCRPLMDPQGYGILMDKDGKEQAVFENLGGLDAASRKALERSLHLRGLTPKILAIHSLAHQYGAVYWKVLTDRGEREFVLKGLTEHLRWLSDRRIIITDVDGNRFEIPDLESLDAPSREQLDLVV